MKHFLKTTLLLLALLLPATAFAYDFKVDGIYYTLIKNRTEVGVTHGSNSYYSTFGYYTGDVCIPSAVTYSGNTYPVTSILGGAFDYCRDLTSIEIPSSVNYIGYGLFFGCSALASIQVESNNPNYDSRDDCNAIIEISSNTLIAGCKNTIIPNSVTTIGNKAFQGCFRLSNIDIPESVTSIGIYAFQHCYDLTSVTIPNSVTDLGQCAFRYCYSLTDVTIGNSVITLWDEMFLDCISLSNITFGNSVRHIGDRSFQGCSSLKSIELPSSLNGFYDDAFRDCSSLKRVTIPSSVTNTCRGTFYECSSLASVTCLATTPPINVNGWSFDTISYSHIPLFIPYKSLSAYKNAEGWKNFINIRALGDLNDDDNISITDVIDLIDRILAGTITCEDTPAADVNGDNIIDIADIVDLIEQLLNSDD